MKTSVRITSIPVNELAELLRKSGAHSASESLIRKQIDSGAPTNPDGTVNLIHYAAWLIKENNAAD